ncbi:integrase [Kitasatospora sp. NPDC057692]|uniref:integrase n=1 Tax=Kitasatospora sp. NPDC057692 TaxID=3346215 RepID=UPI0036D1D409
MTTTAPAIDRFRLPVPSPTTPVVPAHLAAPDHAHFTSNFRDPVWSLAPLVANPGEGLRSVTWRQFPAALRDEIRLVAWTLINGELRPSFVKQRGVKMRTRLSPALVHETIDHWKHFALWLADRDVRSLGACDQQVLHDYGLHLRDTSPSRSAAVRQFTALVRLWAFDGLSGRPAGFARPPWDEFGVDDYLPAASALGGENAREPLAEETMGPLLVWAVRMVEDLSGDILAARRESGRLRAIARSHRSTPQGKAALHAFFEPLLADTLPLPSNSENGAVRLARDYVLALTGASAKQLDAMNKTHALTATVALRPGPCPLQAPVTGLIAARPWREHLDYTETITLMRHLGTAAFIVCAYLTGMRPQEVLALRSGCCPDPGERPDGAPARHLIRVADPEGNDASEEPGSDEAAGTDTHLITGTHFKSAVDEDGNHVAAGLERTVPWVAIPPVVRAIRVLEQIAPAGALLFDRNVHDFACQRSGTGALKPHSMRVRVEDFIAWCNAEAARHGLPHQTIPPDPAGKVGLARFRRTLAWHIARRPGGLVALAIQYGHLRTALDTETSGRYGTRARGGIHSVIDIETALGVAETAADLREHFAAGGGVSGPAARRALLQAARTPRFEGRRITARFARTFLGRDGTVLYDNPHALLLCLYRSDTALCAREGARETPSLDRCVPGCGNTVRTDRHADQLRARADRLHQQAHHTPEPVAERLRTNAARLRSWADEHDRTRLTEPEAPPR